MHPAFSVIFLTTLIGVGQGMFLALFTVESYSAFGLLPGQSDRFYAVGSAIALVFMGLGLFASFFHLSRPERAWRTITQWRTSWLSREVIVLPAFIGALFLYGAAHWFEFNPVFGRLPGDVPVNLTAILGVGGTVLAFTLFLCTGMIYACLRFLREWNTPLTVINYVLLGGASGFTLAAVYAKSEAPVLVGFLGGWAIIITVMALITRGASLIRNARLKPKSTMQTAIGIKHPKIVQKTQGSMGGSFNTREYFHGKTKGFVSSLKWVFLILVFALPLFFLSMGMATGSFVLIFYAFTSQYCGLIVERWVFFAQANHPQNLYYQSVA